MITKKQKEVLRVINNFIVNNKYSPSVRDLALALNLSSTSTVQSHLDRLQEKGYITKNKAMPRTLHILKFPED